MVVTLEDTKAWLRVDGETEDALIVGLIETAEELVEGILRFPLVEFADEVPEPVKHAIYFAVSKLYEERNELKSDELTDVLKALLFSYRKVEW
ncbi:head-tail connector protein [Dehalococcoides sp. THU3]|uniref:head-tail connector protein n=1 Tax=Dehalococcoides TaxID=61434 RepID=UPI0032185DCA